MIVTLMGQPSAGKSFLARKIAEHYGLKQYSLGDLRRQAAAERGLSIAEFNALGEKEDTDTSFDQYQEMLGRTEDDFVIDGRLSAFFIPHAIKVFVDASEDVRAERMLQVDAEHARVGESAEDVADAIALMRARTESDAKRYLRHYGFDPFDMSKYDIVLDTTHLNKQASVNKLVALIDAHLTHHS